eukprot:COSAG03_NODE_2449_length_2748_cov_14.372971_3_plen_246_part_00
MNSSATEASQVLVRLPCAPISPATSPPRSPERTREAYVLHQAADGTARNSVPRREMLTAREVSHRYDVFQAPVGGGATVLAHGEYHRAVLVSHSRRDPAALNVTYALVSALRRELDPDTGRKFSEHCHQDSQRVELWLDNEQLADKGGEGWQRPITRAMRHGVATIFFLGNAFCGSEPCVKELQHAEAKGFRKIPVFLEWASLKEEEFEQWLATKAAVPGGVISSTEMRRFVECVCTPLISLSTA